MKPEYYNTEYWRLLSKITEKKNDLAFDIQLEKLGPIAIHIAKEEIEELEKEAEVHKAEFLMIRRKVFAKEADEFRKKIEAYCKGRDIRITPEGELVEVIGPLGLIKPFSMGLI